MEITCLKKKIRIEDVQIDCSYHYDENISGLLPMKTYLQHLDGARNVTKDF